MTPSARVVIPHTSDAATGGWRDRALMWNLPRWRSAFEHVTHGGGYRTDDPGSFNRPAALNALIGEATEDVIVIADADTTADLSFVLLACEHAVEGGWALARHYRCMSLAFTQRVQAFRPTALITPGDGDIDDETDFSWSGVVVIPRRAYAHVGGSETRHTGWGSDDICLGLALDTLWEPHARLPGSVWHHWHPRPIGHSYGQPNNDAQYALTERYKDAAGHPALMRALIGERP